VSGGGRESGRKKKKKMERKYPVHWAVLKRPLDEAVVAILNTNDVNCVDDGNIKQTLLQLRAQQLWPDGQEQETGGKRPDYVRMHHPFFLQHRLLLLLPRKRSVQQLVQLKF
jgi:hypothetical protein